MTMALFILLFVSVAGNIAQAEKNALLQKKVDRALSMAIREHLKARGSEDESIGDD